MRLLVIMCHNLLMVNFGDLRKGTVAATYHHRLDRHPQGNGLVERKVQTMKTLLKKSLSANEDFHMALLSYRSTPHETTGVSPATDNGPATAYYPTIGIFVAAA